MENDDLKSLIAVIASTSESLDNGEKIYQQVTRTIRRMRITLWVGLIGLMLDLALTLSFALILNEQSNLNDKIQDSQSRITSVSCKTNTLFLQFDTPQRYAAAADKKLYIQQYHTVYENYKNLGCQPVINEPVRSP